MIPFTSHAFLIDSNTAIGSQFTVDYLLETGATDPNTNMNTLGQDISAKVVFTFLESGTDFIWLGVRAENTSELLDPSNEIGLQQLAFGTDPAATQVVFAQDTSAGDADKFTSAVRDDGVGQPEIEPSLTLGNTLILNIGTSTNTGANSTLREQEWDYFTLKVFFNEFILIEEVRTFSVEFTPFSSKWQSSGTGDSEGPSFQFAGTERTTPVAIDPTDPNPVPEPTTLGLLGLGMLAMGALRRRKVALKS